MTDILLRNVLPCSLECLESDSDLTSPENHHNNTIINDLRIIPHDSYMFLWSKSIVILGYTIRENKVSIPITFLFLRFYYFPFLLGLPTSFVLCVGRKCKKGVKF